MFVIKAASVHHLSVINIAIPCNDTEREEDLQKTKLYGALTPKFGNMNPFRKHERLKVTCSIYFDGFLRLRSRFRLASWSTVVCLLGAPLFVYIRILLHNELHL